MGSRIYPCGFSVRAVSQEGESGGTYRLGMVYVDWFPLKSGKELHSRNCVRQQRCLFIRLQRYTPKRVSAFFRGYWSLDDGK